MLVKAISSYLSNNISQTSGVTTIREVLTILGNIGQMVLTPRQRLNYSCAGSPIFGGAIMLSWAFITGGGSLRAARTHHSTHIRGATAGTDSTRRTQLRWLSNVQPTGLPATAAATTDAATTDAAASILSTGKFIITLKFILLCNWLSAKNLSIQFKYLTEVCSYLTGMVTVK